VNRREFLKKLGKAGVSISAAGALSASMLRRLSAAPEAGPPLIRLQGTAKMMGKQYAEQARELILARLKLMREKGSRVARETIEQTRHFLNVTAFPVLEEVRSVAATLGEPEEDMMILSAEPPGVGIRTGGCSSFVIDPKASRDGNVWAGMNVDDSSALERFGVILARFPSESPPMMTWALAGGVGAVGMNAPGLSLTMNYAHATSDRPPDGVFPEFLAHVALRQKDFDAASALLMQTSLMAPCSFILADAGGERVVIERTGLVYRAMKPRGLFAAHTNHFIDPELKAEDAGEKVFPDSGSRLSRLKALLDRKAITPEFLKKVLADDLGKPNAISRSAEPVTIASVLMCPKEKVMFATRGRPDVVQHQEYKLPERP
jgi:isopenicillin-N N-acyltransferase-like protein